MKIAIIVKSLKFGGMERAACNQADAFFLAGHDVDLIYFSNKNKAISPRENGVKINFINLDSILNNTIKGYIWDSIAKLVNLFFRRTYPIIKGYLLSDIFQIELSKLEQTNPYDLILIRGQGTFEQIWKFKDPRSVRICVNVSLNTKVSFKKKLISKCLFEDVHVNCITDGTLDFFKNKFHKEDIKPKSLYSIRNPLFQENILNLAKETNNSIPQIPYILGLGRLVKQKNFQLLINSYKIMKDKYDIIYPLIIVGDGSERNNLEKLVQTLNLEESVLFMGYQNNPYMWMANAEALVITSKVEGLCNVLIEAMCCKTRIIINECPGGMRELMIGKLEKNIIKATPDSIAKGVAEVLNQNKSNYFDDYKLLLDSLEPITIANSWVNTYCKLEVNK